MKPTKAISAKYWPTAAVIMLQCWFGGFTAVGQEAPAAQPGNAMSENAYEMPEFFVTHQRVKGYAPPDVYSAVKFDAAIADLPLTVGIFPKDLIVEMSPNDPKDLNLLSVSSNARSQGSYFRGFARGEELLDGHPSPVRNISGEVLERIEMLKGPAGVLYGQSTPGGITNYLRKRPVAGQDFANFTVGTGTFGRFKAAVDLNSDLADKPGGVPLRYRVVLYHAKNQYHIDAGVEHQHDGKSTIYIPIAFNPWKTMLATVSFMQTERDFASRVNNSAQALTDGDIPLSTKYGIDPWMDFAGGSKWITKTDEFEIDLKQMVGQNLILSANYSNVNVPQDGGYPSISTKFKLVNGEPAVARTFTTRYRGDRYEMLSAFAKYTVNTLNTRQNFLLGANMQDVVVDYSDYSSVTASGATAEEDVFFLRQATPSAITTDQKLKLSTSVRQKTKVKNAYLNYLGCFLDNKWNVVAGMSVFESELVDRNRITLKGDNVSVSPEVTPQVGVLYHLRPDLGVYAMYSTSYSASYTRGGFGEVFPPAIAKGIEAGLKMGFLRGRLFGTVSVYSIRNTNMLAYDAKAPNETYARTGATSDLGAWTQSGEVESNGVEVELAGNVGNWYGSVGYAYNDTAVTADPVATKVGSRIAQWTPHRICAYGRYEFQGALKGLSVGGNYTYQAPSATTLKGLPAKDAAFFIINAFAAYRTTIGGKPVTFQVNGVDLTEARSGSIGYNAATGRAYTYPLQKTQWWFEVRTEL